MLFLVLIPALSFTLLFLIVFSRCVSLPVYDGFRVATLYSFIIASLFVVVITESLSFFSLLRFDALLITWLTVFLILVIFGFRYRSFRSAKMILYALKKMSLSETIIIAVITILLTTSLIMALIYPVNNYDSMAYHMARVGYWEQNHNISHYKTHILRQVEFSPFSEWIILHLQILTGDDRFANAVQLFFFTGCIIVVSLLAKQFNANRRQQILASLVACFIPMAVLESNTTQNDIVVSFFVLAFVFFTAKLFNKTNWQLLFLSGASLGLAWFTKGSGYLFTAVFCGWYLLLLLINYKDKVINLLKKSLIYITIPAIAIIINSGLFYRNIFLSGSPMGSEGKETTNAGFDIKSIAFVGVKNIMNNLPISSEIKNKVSAKVMSWGINPDDPNYSLASMNLMIGGFSFHEDYAQNFPHLILIFFSLIFFLSSKRLYNKPPSLYLLFVLSLIASTALFTILLKWQPWSNRLLTPLFFLFSIVIGVELGRISNLYSIVFASFVVLYGFIALCYNYRHPILPLEKSIFSGKLGYDDFVFDQAKLSMKKYLDQKPYKKIGIYITSDSWDYVYYKLLRDKYNRNRIIKHVFVNNLSNMYMDNYVPDVIISLEQSVPSYSIKGREYRRTAVFNENVIFERVN